MKIGNLEVYGIIYKIENMINSKVYIGQTIHERGFDGRYKFNGKGIERVYKYHNFYKTKNKTYNKHLLGAIKIYGFESFKVVKIFDIAFSKEELDIKEDTYINLFNSIDNGYNNRGGGAKGKLTDKTKNKLRLINLGENHPMYGKHRSDEVRLNMSLGKIGFKHTDEAKEKMRNNHVDFNGKNNPNYGKHLSKESKSKIGNANKGNKNGMYGKSGKESPTSRKVICITTNKEFDTLKEAGEFYKCHRSGIGKCCQGKQKSCGVLNDGTRLEWMYYDEYLLEYKQII